MNAVLLNGYGGVDQLVYTQVPTPTAKAGEVLVKVAGTSVNPADWKIRAGLMKEILPVQLPAILGSDVAGTVVTVGDGVTRFKPGDKVLGFVRQAYAEFVAAKAEDLAPIPEGLAMDQAAVIPLVTLTGSALIEGGVKPKAGDRVLVTGALGSVGRTAVYLAKLHGALVVAGVRKSQKPEALLLGADQVVAVDDDQELASLGEVDAVADTVGGSLAEKLLPKLKKGGTWGSVVGPPASAQKAGVKVAMVQAKPDGKRLGELANDVLAGDLTIPIGARFTLSQIREAHTAGERGGVGKVLITP